MVKFKKLISCVASATLAATSLLSGSSLGASADTTLLTNAGPYTGDATYISTYRQGLYSNKANFEIQFEYTELGTLSAPEEGHEDLGYNDTLEFLVFNTSWGGWDRTTIGPEGYDATSAPTEAPKVGTVYTITVPISVIESKLAEGETPYGINLQTGEQLGTSYVKIVSLKVLSDVNYTQKEFTIEGEWIKGSEIPAELTVTPPGAATVDANEWNIQVNNVDFAKWTNPTIDVTVTYATAQRYVQAEIMLPDGTANVEGTPNYEAIDPNYVSVEAATYTYTTEIPNESLSFVAAYDGCTIEEIHVYDNTEQNVTASVTGDTASVLATKMGLAWDLGNALESSDNQGNVNEKAWGNPKTTKKLIQAVKAAGFNTIRVPISYLNMIDESYDEEGNVNYTVNDIYMARIQQVVNYAYDMGMYVVINIQNDGSPNVTGSWIDISKTGEKFEEIEAKFALVWTDIANNFVGYDQRLVFECANELYIPYNYYTSPDPAYTNINALNQAFVNAVRGVDAEGNNTTTDNNDDRVLIVTGYNTDIDLTVNSTGSVGFVKPKDPTANRLMLSVHYMDPYNFVGYSYYGATTSWGTDAEREYMEGQITKISNFASDLDMPVFLGEYGPELKYTTDNDTSVYNIQYVANYDYWLNYYAKDAGNIVTAYWDNGVTNQTGGTGLFDRTNNVITSNGQIILDAIMDGYKLSQNPPFPNPSLIPSPNSK